MYGRNSSSIFWIVVLELQHNKPTTDGIEDTTTAHEGLKHPGILYYLYQKKEKHNNKAVNQSNAEKQTREGTPPVLGKSQMTAGRRRPAYFVLLWVEWEKSNIT
ncbi:unnamed protein product [Musa acuminata subsp. malaccensis]|uniref:(wild Malaysian banana) hypothetical protein n=1 Tax=Musa acuminata subsp. malaccensis TaxID=214687 RepID=A0A804J4N3_MUSAM|nr:unnamed protein product [Musa acuminata subsp. malaccensis]